MRHQYCLKRPLMWSCIGFTLLGAIFGLSGCGGGGSSSGGGSSANAAPSTTVVQVMTASGRVVLPPGFSTPVTSLTVNTGIGSAAVKADGTFSVPAPGAGPTLATLQDKSGHVILVGYVDPAASGSPQSGGKGEISAQQTAVALLFYALGEYTIPQAGWQNLRNLIGQSPQSTQLASVVSSRVAASATAFATGDSQITNAVQQAVQAILPASKAAGSPVVAHGGVARATSASPTSRASDVASGIVIEPAEEQSGVEVLTSADNSGISFVNHFRRRCTAFVYETGTVDANGNQTDIKPAKQLTFPGSSLLSSLTTAVSGVTNSTAPNTENSFEISTANALNGLVGSLVDVSTGQGAFTPATSGPVSLPADGTAAKTLYQVIVVGPAFSQLDQVSSSPLSQDPHFTSTVGQWQQAVDTLFAEELTLDGIMPLFWSMEFGEQSHVQVNDLDAFKEFVGFLSGLPDMNASLHNGDFAGALKAFAQLVADNAQVREALATFLLKQVTLTGASGTSQTALTALENHLQAVNADGDEIVVIVEAVLFGTDLTAILHDNIAALPVASWNVTVTQGGVGLSPSTSTVSPGQSLVTLTATPGTQGDPKAPFVYHWSVSGNGGGGLEDTTHRSGHDTDFDSVDAQVDYAESLNAQAGETDTVTVQVFQNAGTPQSPSRGTLLGHATSTVNVAAFTSISVSPQCVVVSQQAKSGTFTVTPNVPAPALYRWTLQDSPNFLVGQITDSHGNSSINQIVTTDATVTYSVVTDDNLTTKMFLDDAQVMTVDAFLDDGSHQIPANAKPVATTTVHATANETVTNVSVNPANFADTNGNLTISAGGTATSGTDYSVTVTCKQGNGVSVTCSFADPTDIIVDGKHQQGSLASITREDTTPVISLLGAQGFATGIGTHTFVFHMLPFLLTDSLHIDTFTDLGGHTVSQDDGPWVDAEASPLGTPGQADFPFVLNQDPNLSSRSAARKPK